MSVPIVPVGQRAGDVSSLGQTEMSDSAPASRTAADVDQDARTIQAQPGAGTAAAWGSSRRLPYKSRMPFMIGGGAFLAIAVLAILYVALKKDAPTTEATTTGGTHPPAVTSAFAPPIVQEPTSIPTAAATTTDAGPTTTPTPIVATTAKPTTPNPKATASAKKPVAPPVDTTGFGGRN